MSKQALTVYQELEKPSFLQELAKAIPNTLKPERMVRLAYTLLRKNETLAKCSVVSIMAGVVECAQLGLELEGVLGHAYLVPFAGEATLIIGYRGFAHLMYQSGAIIGISSEIVRVGDTFKRVLGTERRLIHVPNGIPLKETTRKGVYEADDPEENWLGAYAAAKFISGNTEFEYLEKALIFTARARSKSYQAFLREGKETPWMKYPDKLEMWKKTPIRRLAKRMPVSTTDKRGDLLRAAMIDEYSERRGLLIPTLGGYQVNDNPPDEDENAGADVQPTIVVDTEEANPAGKAAKSPKGKKGDANPVANVVTKAKIPSTPIPERPPIDVKPRPPYRAAEHPRQEAARKGALNDKKHFQQQPPAAPADPFIDTTEQTDLYNKALMSGWKIDEFRTFLTKRFKVDSVKALKRSQLPAIRTAIESGT